MTDFPKLIDDIIVAITRYGEEATDGECLDEVWGLLETAGYAEQLREMRSKAELEYLQHCAEQHGETTEDVYRRLGADK